MLAGVGDAIEKLLRVPAVQFNHISRCQHDGIHVNRKRRRGDNRRIARSHQRQAHMAEAFLRTKAGDYLAVGFKPDAIPLPVPFGDFLPQVADSAGHGIAMVPRIPYRLGQLFTDQRVRCVRRIAHAQVDHVNARDACFSLLIRPNRYGGRRFNRSATGIENGASSN